jgi:hypothetical protein
VNAAALAGRPSASAALNTLVMLVIMGGCTAHTATISMNVAEPDEALCAMAADAAETVASEFALRNAVPPGMERSVLTDGSVVLASYRATGALSPSSEGSHHTVYLTVFAKNSCRNIAFAITDYDQANESKYVQHLRSRVLDLLRRSGAEAEVTTTATTTRTLPP